MPTVVTRSAGRFQLEVDGAAVGSLRHFSGLGLEADIAQNDVGPGSVPKKHVTNFKWAPGVAKLGLGMGKGMYEWIKASFAQTNVRRDGAFKVADANGKVQSSLNFNGGIMTSVTVPKLDGSSKESGFLDIAFQAEQVRWALAPGEDISHVVARPGKAWVTSNFKLSLGNLPCARVAAVDAFTWRCEPAADSVGVLREPTTHPAKVTVPDIRLTISAADFLPWAEAAKKWFVDGQRMDGDEMQGRITLLDPTLNDANAMGWIDLVNVGFKSFTPPEADTAADRLLTFSVELYVEQMRFSLKALEP